MKMDSSFVRYPGYIASDLLEILTLLKKQESFLSKIKQGHCRSGYLPR